MGRRLYVANFPFDTTEADLRKFFAPREVVSVKIITDRETGRSRGFGFVEVAAEADAQAAIDDLNGCSLGGRTIRVDHAEEKGRNGGGRPVNPPNQRRDRRDRSYDD